MARCLLQYQWNDHLNPYDNVEMVMMINRYTLISWIWRDSRKRQLRPVGGTPWRTTEALRADQRKQNPTMAAAVAAVSIQSASPARELTLSAQQAAIQATGDRIKKEEEGTGENLFF